MSLRMVSYSIASSPFACTSPPRPGRAFLRASFDDAYVIRGYFSLAVLMKRATMQKLTKTSVPSSGDHEINTILFLLTSDLATSTTLPKDLCTLFPRRQQVPTGSHRQHISGLCLPCPCSPPSRSATCFETLPSHYLTSNPPRRLLCSHPRVCR